MTETPKPGDRVRVTFEGTMRDDGFVRFGDDFAEFQIPIKSFGSSANIEILPPIAKPLEREEVVKVEGDTRNHMVVAASGQLAWLKAVGYSVHGIYHMQAIYRESGVPIAETVP